MKNEVKEDAEEEVEIEGIRIGINSFFKTKGSELY